MAAIITITASKPLGFEITNHPAKDSKAKGTVLHQRNFTGGITIDINSIPPRVLESLLIDAIKAKLQAAVKKLDQEKCTQAEAQAAMQAAYESLKSGTAAKKGQSLQTQIRAEARRLLKAALKERNDNSDEPEEMSAKDYTEKVSMLFKTYDKWLKTKDADEREEFAPLGEYIGGLLETAEKRLKDKGQVNSRLDALLASRPARAASDTGAAAAPKPTPTQAEKARRAKGGGASSRQA